jgi:hypothetical protein
VDIKYVDLDTKEIIYFNLNGGCKGYSCTEYYVYTPHYSFAIVRDEKKMKTVGKEMRNIKEMNKHKERIMKKKQQESTPIASKKVVNIEFKTFKNEAQEPFSNVFVGKKEEVVKYVKILPKETFKPIVPPKLFSMGGKKKE